MLKRYKAIISNKNIYKEIELPPEAAAIKVGTDIDSDVRLRKEFFFGSIELNFIRDNENWSLFCSDNLRITGGGVKKLMTKVLKHGDTFDIEYQDSNITVFTVLFSLDFEYETKLYDTEIDIEGKSQIIIGGTADADIYLNDSNIGTDRLILRNENDVYTVIDDNSQYGVCVNGTRISEKTRIKDYDFFSIAVYSFYYKKGKLYTASSDEMRIKGFMSKHLTKHISHFDYPEFIRNTRIQYCLPEEEIEIKQPMPKPQKPKKNLVLSLIPSVAMLVLLIVIRVILSSSAQTGTFVIYSACSMSIGIIMSVVMYFYDGKQYKKDLVKRESEYKKYISVKESEIKASRDNELRIRNLIFESLNNSIDEVFSYGKRIFEKSPVDKDFLDIYLGKGIVEAAVPIKYTQEDFIDTEDSVSLLPAEIEKKYHYIENAPVVSHLNADNVGIAGSKPMLQSMLKNITLDLAIRHFYKEVKFYYILDKSELKNLQWIRWLRHIRNDEIGIRNFMCDEESRKILLENLYSILSMRETVIKENESAVFDVHYVVFVLDASYIRNHPITKYIGNSSKYSFTFVFFEEFEEFIPKGCAEIIRLNPEKYGGTILMSENGDVQTEFTYDGISNELAEETALKLGAVSVEEISLESELTKSISMYEMLNIFSIEDLDLKKRWSNSQVYKSMAAPLGVKTKNEIVYLDISDASKAHGPHGLVAGTTGSGKSEILQTYVLSMATLFHPYDVGFVIIDFKGGGMANQFKDLPHMMGAITDIDGHEINRSLLSIKAELDKRKMLFAEAGVNHINDYIKLYKKGTVAKPLPHLIIIVDEFAELKAEFPDFMKELISAARIGRTLGVHLILATQKPAGVIDSQIWSNSKFKLCLKVQSKEDSNEVIKTPLAAEIVEPGRAYFQVGNNEIFELFQSAYSGVKVTADGDNKEKIFSIYSLNDWGKRTLIYANKKKQRDENAKNQLQTIVEYVNNYCRTSGIAALNGICLPSLADVIKRNALSAFTNASKDIIVPVGIYDDPERQNQGNYCINLSSNNTYIIGSAMTGKTTLLQTVLLQLMRLYTPDDINVYIVDCGNMALKSFENSNMVGGVAITSEEDKVMNLFKLLFRIMDERKKTFSAKGLGTHKAYVEAGFTGTPQILLMIDNLAAFREYYDNLSDDFLALSREGNSLGISVIAAASQTNAMNYRALSNYGTRISFVCNDSGEYMNLFDRCRMEPKDTPGRGLCVIDKRILEFQTALCVEGDIEFDRVENIKKEIAACNEKYPFKHALPIPVVPEIIKFSQIKNDKTLYRNNYRLPIGIQYSTVQYAMLDLLSVGLIATLGREKSGKTNLIKQLMAAIQVNVFGTLTQAYVIDNPSRALQKLKDYGFVEKYTVDITELPAIVDEIAEILEERRDAISDDASYSLDNEPLLLLIIENNRLFEQLQSSKETSAMLVKLLKQYKKYKFAVILSEIENANVPFNAPEFIKYVKENKKFIFFDELTAVKFFDVTVRQQKENTKPLKLGDAFLCLNGEVERIKTILYEEV